MLGNRMGAMSIWIANLTTVSSLAITHSDGPVFRSKPGTVTVDNGSVARLPCNVVNLGPLERVAWFSEAASKLLTIDRVTMVTSNHVVINVDISGGFQLQINNVTSEDAGAYKCIVTTEPVMEQTTTLRVKQERWASRKKRKYKHVRNSDKNLYQMSHLEI